MARRTLLVPMQKLGEMTDLLVDAKVHAYVRTRTVLSTLDNRIFFNVTVVHHLCATGLLVILCRSLSTLQTFASFFFDLFAL